MRKVLFGAAALTLLSIVTSAGWSADDGAQAQAPAPVAAVTADPGDPAAYQQMVGPLLRDLPQRAAADPWWGPPRARSLHARQSR